MAAGRRTRTSGLRAVRVVSDVAGLSSAPEVENVLTAQYNAAQHKAA